MGLKEYFVVGVNGVITSIITSVLFFIFNILGASTLLGVEDASSLSLLWMLVSLPIYLTVWGYVFIKLRGAY